MTFLKLGQPFSTSLLAMTIATAVTGVQAQTLDLSINNESVGVDYTNQISGTEVNFGAGLLHNQDNGDAYWASLFVADNVNKQAGILAGIGGRLYYLDADQYDNRGTAVGLGGFVNWDIPTLTNLSLRGDLYYAPDVLSFDEVSRFTDFSLRVQYRIIEQAWLHVGYRHADMKGQSHDNQTIEEGMNLGIMLWF